MDISPDGNYLFVVDVAATALTEYSINASRPPGAREQPAASPHPLPARGHAGHPDLHRQGRSQRPVCSRLPWQRRHRHLSLHQHSGITSASPALIGSGSTSTNPTGDYSVTLDKNNYVFIARTAALAVYQITDAAGDATLQSTATFSSTATPRSVTLSNNEGYVYTANEGSE